MTMNHRKKAVRPHTVAGACVLVAALGFMAYGSASGETEGRASSVAATSSGAPAQAAEASRATDPAAAGRLLALSRTDGIEVDADAARTVPAPGAGPSWLLAPVRGGGACVDTSRVVFCGTDQASIDAGRAAATEYPPDEHLGKDPRTGFGIVKPSDGTGIRRGIAPPGAVHVVVLDRNDGVVRREAVAHGVYEIVVPAQGSGARVAFVDAAGATIAKRPVEG